MIEDWEEVVEDGQTFYVNEEIGNIVKLSNNNYVAMVPRVIKLGSFLSLEDAKQACKNLSGLDQILDEYNLSLIKKNV